MIVMDTLAYMWLSQNVCELCSGFITHHLHRCTWALLKAHLHTFSSDLLVCHCHSPLHLVWCLEPASFPEDFHSWEQLAISNTVALRWLRGMVTSRSLWSPNFDPRPVHVGFVVEKVALGQVFPPSTSVFPSHSHSSSAGYSYIQLSPVLYKSWKLTALLSSTLTRSAIIKDSTSPWVCKVSQQVALFIISECESVAPISALLSMLNLLQISVKGMLLSVRLSPW